MSPDELSTITMNVTGHRLVPILTDLLYDGAFPGMPQVFPGDYPDDCRVCKVPSPSDPQVFCSRPIFSGLSVHPGQHVAEIPGLVVRVWPA